MLESLSYIFLLGMFLGYVFMKLRLPALVGMLLTGVILGSSGLGLLSPSILSISLELRQIALVIILMRAGLALDIGALRRAGTSAIFLCFIPATFEIAGVVILAPMLLGISYLEAALMGAVLAAVSPAVVVPKMLKLTEEGYGVTKGIPQMIMAAGSVDDLYVIVLFTALLNFGSGGEIALTDFAQVPTSIALGLVLGVAVGWLLVQYFKRFHLRDSLKMIILMSVAFLFITLESALKGRVAVSGLLATMAMGATILQLHEVLARRISPKFSKLWIAAEMLLFVLVGASVDIGYLTHAGWEVVALLLLVITWRMVGVFAATLVGNFNFKERLFCMIAYIPKATVQAAIGSIPLSMGLACGELVLTVAVTAIFITAPLGALGIDLTYKSLLDVDQKNCKKS
ncbi:MAG: cation:proton antiporter [Rikenellaceae bacterium]